MTFDRAVPVLQVSDVAKSMRWYRQVLGFDGSAFPEKEPYTFALLCRDNSELMLQKSKSQANPASRGWSVYIRLVGNRLLDLAEHVRVSTPLLREPERMPYRDVEFSVSDPDGHEIVLSEQLPDGVDVPTVEEGKSVSE